MRLRGWWFDRAYVLMSRPLDIGRFPMLDAAFASSIVVGDETLVMGEWITTDADGGVSTWVPRWRVRQYERAGWVRGLASWPIP